MIPTAFALSLFIFIMMRVMPGDVATLILVGAEGLGESPDPAAVEAIRIQLGLDKPLPLQYVVWVGDLFFNQGGDSLWSGQPVFAELARRIPMTAELAIASIIMAHLIAIPAGVISAVVRNSWLDYLVRIIAIVGTAIPNFWLGILMILGLTYFFSWSIPLGYASILSDPWENIQQLFFPTIVLGTALSATLARMTRATVLEVLGEDYVRTARAKGVAERTVLVRHVLRNSLLPVITLSGLQLGGLIGGTVVIETVFALPGIGRFLVNAIFRRDYVVVQSIVLLFGLSYMFVNLATDVAYAALDPRIRYD